MALISCPDCAREISDKAPSCPNCGAPISTAPAADEKWEVASIGWATEGSFSNSTSGPRQSVPKARIVQASPYTFSPAGAIILRMWLTKGLHKDIGISLLFS
jgi:hypothetical protein